MNVDLSICLVTSPAPCHPSLILVEEIIESLKFIPEISLATCPLYVICDGYQITNENRTKKGRVTAALARNYEDYKIALSAYFHQLKCRYESFSGSIHSLDSHQGFAHAVKVGLSLCTTKYCLIAQHDRIFCHSFPYLRKLIDVMDRSPHIRYVGFPSVTSNTHNAIIQSNHRLNCLNEDDMIIPVHYGESSEDESIYLQPLVFWYDSQHLCHVKRYLEIFQPYLNIPSDLKSIFGNKIMNGLVLRRGDFIEDRFGQHQLKSLVKLRELEDRELIKRAFRWYGSYLVWIPGIPFENYLEIPSKSIETKADPCSDSIRQDEPKESSKLSLIDCLTDQEHPKIKYPILNYQAKPIIRHLRGRQFDLVRESGYEEVRMLHAQRHTIHESSSSIDIDESFDPIEIFSEDTAD